MEIVIQRFCLIAWRALNFSTVGYEPFSNRDWSQGATNNASQISASHVVAFGPLRLSLGSNFLDNSWVKSGGGSRAQISRPGPASIWTVSSVLLWSRDEHPQALLRAEGS